MTSFIKSRLGRATADAQRGRPTYLFGGRVRTSTVVLVIAFLAVWWVYDAHQQSVNSTNKTPQAPATQVVPPGFVPDPNYTWVPRTRVQAPPTTTETPTTTPPPPTTTTPPPPFGVPQIVLPPPFGPPTTPSPAPPPGPAAPPAPLLPGLP